MIPKRHAKLNAGKACGTSPMFCRECGKAIKIARGGKNNIREICGKCSGK